MVTAKDTDLLACQELCPFQHHSFSFTSNLGFAKQTIEWHRIFNIYLHCPISLRPLQCNVRVLA
jgi:hypothetical protein